MRLERKPKRKILDSKLFIAFDLPIDLKRKLYANNRIFTKESRNIRFVEPEQMHMTIKYLGNNISNNTIAKVVEVLHEISLNTFPVHIEIESLRIGFPHQLIPKLIFYNIEPTLELDRIYIETNRRLRKLDIPELLLNTSLKKDVYHISIGRLKHQLNRAFIRKLREIVNNFEFDPLEFELNEFLLIRSDPISSQGVKYTILQRFKLKSS
jgi:2'-5' RNA ligase